MERGRTAAERRSGERATRLADDTPIDQTPFQTATRAHWGVRGADKTLSLQKNIAFLFLG
jgi:hypothetical protein